MARPREFDRTEVLDRAMQLFWEKGFDCTSIQDLVERMGIGRASMYDTFGSKEQLLFEALDHYANQTKDRFLSMMDRPGPVPEVLGGLFRSLLGPEFAGSSRSCLMTKSALMNGRHNDQVQARVCRFMAEIEDALCDLLQRGQAEGDIAADRDPRALARFLANIIQGMSVTSCAGAAPAVLEDVVTVTLSILR